MTTWIGGGSITCREVHATHNEVHNTLTGNPSFSARIAVPYSQLEDAVAALLGTPETWPKATSILQDVVCVAAQADNDGGRYTTDSNGETINYDQYALLALTYMPRIGRYVTDDSGEDVFWNDEVSPRRESKPMNHLNLIWGTTDPTGIPNEKIQLHSDEAPPKYESGVTLIHTIEGFDLDYSDLRTLIGTVAQAQYTSPVTGEIYAAETLLLNDYAAINHFNFKSYRTGTVSTTLKLFYEFKDVGWNRFWRNDLVNKTTGYYYIRQNVDPWDRVDPFPLADHDKYLNWVP